MKFLNKKYDIYEYSHVTWELCKEVILDTDIVFETRDGQQMGVVYMSDALERCVVDLFPNPFTTP